MVRVTPYPQIEPYTHDILDMGDGNAVYWETCGTPTGKPAIVFHGGPGSGCSPQFRSLFDPEKFRIVLFDQRGCGRSTPHAGGIDVEFSTNTTAHLLDDIERLRTLLNIERWLIYGGSWGSTLALAYAEAYPDRVSELVLGPVTTTRRSEIDWLYGHVGRLLPSEWAEFKDGSPADAFGHSLVEAYWHRLTDPDPAIHQRAADNWCRWEAALVSVDPRSKPSTRWSRPDFRLAFARIVTHYFRHDAWLEDGILLRNANALASIPGTMIHASLDLAAPLTTARELASAWPTSELVLVEGALHSANDAAMTKAIITAIGKYAGKA